MTDYKNFKTEEKNYPKLSILRDGMGILTLAILGYFACCGIFIL